MVTRPLIKKDGHLIVAVGLGYQVAFSSVKATYLAQYRRAFAFPSIKLLCDVFMGILFIITSAVLILGGVVMRGFTDPDPNKLPDTTSTGFTVFIYLSGGSNLVTGIVIFILPITLVGRMRLAKTEKARLIASFGVGIFTCAISILRILSVRMGYRSDDPYYGVVPLTLLGAAEVTSAVVCACLPLMRPLLSCFGKTGSRGNGSREPLTPAPGESVSRIHWRHGLPLHSPATPTFSATPQMVRVVDSGGSINGDIEGYHASQQVRESTGGIGPLAIVSSTPTTTRADHGDV
ncbi:hypothetical protein LZ30DRAFT_713308 [Colletotrichum cereale]|nr:hypothetical protein LZ30DRAFT_713308 [Colletotrichum cereale]